MTKLNITRLGSVTSNDAAATAAINNNFRAIQDAVENTLSRDGTTPNFMDSDLDLNNHKIINVKDPEASTDVITKGWFDQFVDDASSAAGEALASALAAASSAQASNISATEARDWATKMDDPVEGANYSSKYYASLINNIATDIEIVAAIDNDVTAVANNSEDISTVAELSTEIPDVAEALSVYTSQEGHAGEYLTTDGTDTSWDNVKLVENAQDESTLGIWQGSQQEWEQADVTDWKNWQTDAIISTNTENSGRGNTYSITCSQYITDGTIVVALFIGESNCGIYTKTGNSWTKTLNSGTWQCGCYFKGKFYAFGNTGTSQAFNNVAYSEDGENWTTATIENLDNFYLQKGKGVACSNEYIVLTASSAGSQGYTYSSDGLTWTNRTSFYNGQNHNILYKNGRFLANAQNVAFACYSDDITSGWTNLSNPPSTGDGWTSSAVVGDNFYILTARYASVYPKLFYSSDGIEWGEKELNFLPQQDNSIRIVGCGAYLVAIDYTNKKYWYSDNTTTWGSVAKYSSNQGGVGVCYTEIGGLKLYVPQRTSGSTYGERLYFSYAECYTTTTTPTTESTVYSAPNTTSALTITSVGAGTITLSNSQVYNRKASGDTQTYQDVASLYPNHLAFVDNVGVKIGNTLIADNTDISSKADKDLSNLSTAGKEVVSNLPMPSKSAETLTVGASGTSYTATANGWFCFSSTTASASRSHLSIALNGVTQHLGMVVAEYTGSAGNRVFCPAAKGDSVTVYYSNTSSVEGYFIYAEGDK